VTSLLVKNFLLPYPGNLTGHSSAVVSTTANRHDSQLHSTNI
jgi:hypothetical protein